MTAHVAHAAETEEGRALLAELYRCWGRRCAQLTPEQWAQPTRLPGWDVAALVAHICVDPALFDAMPQLLAPGPAQYPTAAEMLRAFNAPDGLARTGAQATAAQACIAAAATSTDEFVARFAALLPAALERTAALGRDAVVLNPALGTVTYGAMGDIAILEAVVHYLDLLDAVGGPPLPARALEHAARTLALVPEPVAFLEAATGRSTAAVLPVMR
jgi:uncharacterized protein (TIGR03083 family)